MPMEELVAAFIEGESFPVEASAIEKELAALWQSAAESKNESIRSMSRACQGNLLIYAPNEGAYERAAIALPEIMRRHPARVIALIAEPGTENEDLAAFISVPPISTESRGEQITIAAKGNAVKSLAGIAPTLCIANMPVALWWLGDLPEEDPLFEQLLAVSQRLIFDSAFSLDVGNELSRARALSLTWKDGLCSDLNWLRLARCHELIRQFLDSSDAAPMLSHIEKISFEVIAASEGDAHFAQPFLLLGWLAGRLILKLNEPLTPLGENIFQTNWQSGGREVIGAITLHKPTAEADESPVPIGVMAVQMQFRQNNNAMAFELRRNPRQPQATIRVTKGEQTVTESSVDFANLAPAELMAQAHELTDRDQAYENALRFATQLI